MKRRLGSVLLALGLAGLFAASAQAETALDGQTRGGAYFRIVVPDAWNGDLVIYNHGFSLSPIGPVSDLGPLAQLQLAEGYAVAASSYRMIGWALFRTHKDLKALYKTFLANFGEPNNTIITGASLGGIVTAQALEKTDLGNQSGAYPICGAVAGSRSWDGGFDIRLIYDAVCGDVPGAAIAGGSTGLPSPGFPDTPITTTDMALAVHACTGVLAPAAFRTPDQAARLDQILTVTTLPESFLLTDMGFATFGLSNLIFAPEKLKGKQGLGNAYVVYPDPVIDATIQRVKANKGAAKRLAKHFTPKGDLRDDTKIVSIQTSGDGLVIVEHESEYQKVIDPANLTVGIVVEAQPTHCGFTAAEVTAGWESLRGWMATDLQPSVATIQGTCLAIEASGAAPGPCRFDPSFVIGNFDDRVLPRGSKPKKDDD